VKQRARLQDDARPRQKRLPQPNFFAEWAVNLLILLFATAMIAQPYVIPTGSMEDSLLIGDHLIVDKLANHVVNGELVVPEGNYFAMGDNRDLSLDSRYWGFVPRDNIVGKPVLVWWSYDAPTERLMSGNIDIEHLLDIARNFFQKTRWDRTFRLISGYPLD
jgi:hypothetical protein